MNTKLDKQHIYEIFRACRLCGAGGGYKMPIIQNIIDLEDSEIELKEKIRECVNIEINPNDCMPPLICELCVDKVNDFYDFVNMCRQTNKRTRLRLGLPLQTNPREAPQKDTSVKKHAVKSIFKPQKRSPKQQGKDVSMKEVENKDTLRSLRSLKRCKGKQEHSSDASTKRVKVSTEISPQEKALTKPKYICLICNTEFKKSQSLANHLRSHTVTFTSVNLACNACCKWFANAEETAAHHRMHATKRKPYHCIKCITNFRNLPAYDLHFKENKCVPWTENPDAKCMKCQKSFPTENLRKKHRCKVNVKFVGECGKCMKSFNNLKTLNEHKCIFKSREYMKIRKKLLPMQVRLSRCDPLLADSTKEHCDVSMIDIKFGLDPNCVYPYFASGVAIKREPMDDFDGMVNIMDDIKQEFCHEDEFIHWDSNNDSDNEKSNVSSIRSSPNLMANLYGTDKEVNSLSNLTLESVFSKDSLDKVPKKRRKSQHEETEKYEEDCPVFKGFVINSVNENTNNNDKENDKDCRSGEYEESNVNSNNVDMKNDDTNDTNDVQSTASEETDTEMSTVNEIVEKSDTSEYKNQNNYQCDDIEKVNNDHKEIKTNGEINHSNANESESIEKSDDFFSKNEEVSKNVEDSNMLKTDANNEKIEKCDTYIRN